MALSYQPAKAEFEPLQSAAPVTISPTKVLPAPGPLSEEDLDLVLSEAGWPEDLRPAAKSVMYCESTWNSLARNGQYRGLFQLSPLWFDYAGVDIELWADPMVNARVAYLVVEYDLAREWDPWAQWECKP